MRTIIKNQDCTKRDSINFEKTYDYLRSLYIFKIINNIEPVNSLNWGYSCLNEIINNKSDNIVFNNNILKANDGIKDSTIVLNPIYTKNNNLSLFFIERSARKNLIIDGEIAEDRKIIRVKDKVVESDVYPMDENIVFSYIYPTLNITTKNRRCKTIEMYRNNSIIYKSSGISINTELREDDFIIGDNKYEIKILDEDSNILNKYMVNINYSFLKDIEKGASVIIGNSKYSILSKEFSENSVILNLDNDVTSNMFNLDSIELVDFNYTLSPIIKNRLEEKYEECSLVKTIYTNSGAVDVFLLNKEFSKITLTINIKKCNKNFKIHNIFYHYL